MKVLLILVAIFFVLKLLTKYLGPLLLMYASKKVTEKFNNQFDQTNNYQNSENHQTTTPKKQMKVKKTVGEYIDFEEID